MKFYGMSIKEYVDHIQSFNNHTWIWFDTETTGLKVWDSQITEIASIASTPSIQSNIDFSAIDEYRKKAKLTQDTKDLMSYEIDKPWDKWPKRRLLKLNRYGEPKGNVEYINEQELFNNYGEWLLGFKQRVMIAQNATFDWKMINGRAKTRIPSAPTVDTYITSQLFWIPLMQTLAKQGDERAIDLINKLTVDRGNGRKSITFSLGPACKALGINTEGWHSAIADTYMMVEMFKVMFNDLLMNQDVDILTAKIPWISKVRSRKPGKQRRK